MKFVAILSMVSPMYRPFLSPSLSSSSFSPSRSSLLSYSTKLKLSLSSSSTTSNDINGRDCNMETPLSLVLSQIVSEPATTTISNLENTILHVPSSAWSERGVLFKQKATSLQVQLNSMEELQQWNYGSDLIHQLQQGNLGVQCTIEKDRIDLLDPETVLVKWNVTWTPPNAQWLYQLGTIWPDIAVVSKPYTELASEISVFRWSSIFRLFLTAFRDKVLIIPLATIQGRSYLTFASQEFDNEKKQSSNEDSNGTLTSSSRSTTTSNWKLIQITEELGYAEDLQCYKLQNRRCAQDLRLFLELGRKPPIYSWSEWENVVAKCLPWNTVPGSGALDIEPMANDGELGSYNAAVMFLGSSMVLVFIFASIIAPELIG